jgi:hypothetical protein
MQQNSACMAGFCGDLLEIKDLSRQSHKSVFFLDLYLARSPWRMCHDLKQIGEQALQQAIWPARYPSTRSQEISACRADLMPYV